MSFPNMKQGGYRSKPDGFLHMNNYAHSVKSGIAGVLFERIMTTQQRNSIEELLREVALVEMARSGTPLFHFKHNVYRFEKEFLHANFKRMVYAYLKLTKKSASTMLAMAATGELIEVCQNGGIPQIRFK